MELLQKVLLDVEVALNNRPLDYVEDDIQLPILTPSSLLHIQPNALPELESNHIQDYDLRDCPKYLSKCKDTVWSRKPYLFSYYETLFIQLLCCALRNWRCKYMSHK